MSRQKMGQHFLGNAAWQKRILDSLPHSAQDNSGDAWIEIGAGHGEMTHLLAAEGRRVISIEADTRLAEKLEQRVRENPREWPGVEIISSDVLKLDLGKLVGGKFHVYGNLPYYITSPILHQLFGYADQIASIHIVIQLEVAQRIVSPPENRAYGYLSVACQFYTTPEIAFRIPPGAFRPPPRVTSALLSMSLPGQRSSLGVTDEKRFLEFVQLCFGQKRKTLRNNLRTIASDERIHGVLATCSLRPDARAEQLSVAQFVALFNEIAHPAGKNI